MARLFLISQKSPKMYLQKKLTKVMISPALQLNSSSKTKANKKSLNNKTIIAWVF